MPAVQVQKPPRELFRHILKSKGVGIEALSVNQKYDNIRLPKIRALEKMERLKEVFELGGLLVAQQETNDGEEQDLTKKQIRSVSLAKEHFIPSILASNRRLRSLETLEKVQEAYDKYSKRYKSEQARILEPRVEVKRPLKCPSQVNFLESRAKSLLDQQNS